MHSLQWVLRHPFPESCAFGSVDCGGIVMCSCQYLHNHANLLNPCLNAGPTSALKRCLWAICVLTILSIKLPGIGYDRLKLSHHPVLDMVGRCGTWWFRAVVQYDAIQIRTSLKNCASRRFAQVALATFDLWNDPNEVLEVLDEVGQDIQFGISWTCNGWNDTSKTTESQDMAITCHYHPKHAIVVSKWL